MHTKVLIIGSGPAGYTAAIYAARALLEPVLVTGLEQGGQLMITTEVENYPGFAEQIQGPWLMEQMRDQAKAVGTNLVNDHIKEVDFNTRPFVAVGESGTVYTADAVIISTGAKAMWLGIEGEEKFKGFGVSACATCDGFFYKGRNVIVVGGGNTAVEEALYLSNLAERVTLVHRRDALRAEKILQRRLMNTPNIDILWHTVLEDVVGDEGLIKSVKGAKLRNVQTNAAIEMDIDGIFIAIGHAPAVDLFTGKLDHTAANYLWTAPDSTATSVPGVFAAGDVTDDIYRQAVTAAGQGCMAALEAEKYLAAMADADIAAE